MKYVLPILFLFLSACVQTEPEFVPELPRETFKEALKRSLLIEARANKERVDLKQEHIPIDSYYQTMYKEMGITEKDYLLTFDQFTQHPLAFEDLFEELSRELKIEADSLQRLMN